MLGRIPVSLTKRTRNNFVPRLGRFGMRGHDRAFPGRDMSRPQSGVMPPHSIWKQFQTCQLRSGKRGCAPDRSPRFAGRRAPRGPGCLLLVWTDLIHSPRQVARVFRSHPHSFNLSRFSRFSQFDRAVRRAQIAAKNASIWASVPMLTRRKLSVRPPGK